MELLQTVIMIVEITFVLSSMIGVGLGLRVSEIVAPLRQWRLVAQALLANFVIAPIAAVALTRIMRLDESQTIGLLLFGAAAGSPFLPTLAKFAKGSMAHAVALMVMLMVVTAGYLPIVLPVLLPGVSVSAWDIARPLIFQMLVPLGGALAVKAYWPDAAARAKPPLDKTSFASLMAVVVLLTLTNFRSIVGVFGSGCILAGIAFVATSYAAGWILGPTGATRAVMGLGTAQRNIAAALLVATQSFEKPDPNVLVVIVVTTLVALFMLMPLARAAGRRSADVATVG